MNFRLFQFILLLVLGFSRLTAYAFYYDCIDTQYYSELITKAGPNTPAHVALGFFAGGDAYNPGGSRDALRHFAAERSQELGRLVVTFTTFNRVGYIVPGPVQREHPVITMVEGAIVNASKRSPGEVVVHFNLDGFDPARAFDPKTRLEEKSGSSIVRTNFTAYEARLILSNKPYFKITRWYRDRKALSAEQVKQLFQPYFPKLFGT